MFTGDLRAVEGASPYDFINLRCFCRGDHWSPDKKMSGITGEQCLPLQIPIFRELCTSTILSYYITRTQSASMKERVLTDDFYKILTFPKKKFQRLSRIPELLIIFHIHYLQKSRAKQPFFKLFRYHLFLHIKFTLITLFPIKTVIHLK